MNIKSMKPLEIVGTVIALIGLIYWISTPGDVLVGPLVVIVIGAAIVGGAKLSDRSKEDESARGLMEELRSERERGDGGSSNQR